LLSRGKLPTVFKKRTDEQLEIATMCGSRGKLPAVLKTHGTSAAELVLDVAEAVVDPIPMMTPSGDICERIVRK
jgi:hypothetical protein